MNKSTQKRSWNQQKNNSKNTNNNKRFFWQKKTPHKNTHTKKKHIPNPPGFYCDILVLSPESWRHLGAGAGTVVPLVRAGLESYDGPQGVGSREVRLITPY